MSDFLTVTEAATIVRVHPETMRDWLRTGKIRGVKFGGQWRTTREWLDDSAEKPVTPYRPSEAERQKRAAASAQRVADKYGIRIGATT